ncbi:MAG: DNA primase [Candidatus Wildermuthbacteria bacterium]|nr:DNA primase [Candidatus Wildermuthbacteria bacterium]
MLSPIEEIKNRLDILAVVKEYVQLQKAGANYRALCPFHSEKGPSFFVSPGRQTWKCFGCGLGGDVFQFIMQIEGIEFGDALRLLAQKAGVELPQRDPAFMQWETERKRLLELMELATQFFEKQLEGSQIGEEATNYLMGERGLTKESIAKWRVGYAPESANSLFSFLSSRGFREQEIGRAGLLVRSEGQTYDRFRSRIMFPIFDLHSATVGFGGRIFGKKADADLAKYINTSNTPLYDKSKILYGLDKAKLAIRRNDFCVLVEGYFDVILVSQAGTENVVAASGTALTDEHVKVLKRYSENLFASFDGDAAGESATKKGIDRALGAGFRIKVVLMPPPKDPADVVKENSEQWKELLQHAKSISDFYFETTFAKFDKHTSEGQNAIAKTILPVIKKLQSRVEQDFWIRRLAEELCAREESVREELSKIKNEDDIIRRSSVAKVGAVEMKSRKELLEEQIVFLLFRTPENVQQFAPQAMELVSPATREIIAAMQKNPQLDFSLFGNMLSKESVEYLRGLTFQADMEEGESEGEKELQSCLKELKALYTRERLSVISREIKQAEKEQDHQKLQQLMQEFHHLSTELHLLN